mmetsp:Transcript_33893/g.89280  ORF Transcript_33893/g.89280 Transcript_33893/m.89280 type:complete len:82 (+) Transcript_33893:789-1034(+)
MPLVKLKGFHPMPTLKVARDTDDEVLDLSVAISSAEVCVRLRIMRLNCVICLMPSDSLVSACEMGGAELRTVRQESSSQRH